MIKIKLFILLICAVVVEASGEDFKAKFTTTVTNSDSTISIKNQSTKKATTYIMNFGDGTIFTDADYLDYVHKYKTSGTFNVCLIVTDGVQSDTACKQVIIEGVIVEPTKNVDAQFIYTTGETDSTLYITNQSSNYAISYTINYGDGTIITGAQFLNYQHKYSLTGTYDVCLIVSNGANADTACKQVIIEGVIVEPINTVNAQFIYALGKTDSTLYITNQSSNDASSYTLNYGDGTIVTGALFLNYQHKYSLTGTYDVCLIVTDGIQSDTACKQVIIEGVIVEPTNTVKAQFIYTIGETDSTLYITNQSSNDASLYTINYGDGRIITDTQLKDYKHKYTEVGQYDVCLIVTSGVNADTACEQVVIISADTTSIIVPSKIKAKFKYTLNNTDSTIYITNQSSKGAVFYTINYGDGIKENYSQYSDYQHKYSEAGTYNVCLIVTDGLTADTACEQIVFETTGVCNAKFDYLVSGMTLTLKNRSIGDSKKVTWSLADIKKVVNEDSFVYEFLNPGVYAINLQIADNKTNCESAISKSIQIQGDANTCLASFTYNYISHRKLHFVNTSVGDYDKLLWKFGNGDVSEEPNPEYEFAHPGIYNVSLVVKSKNNKEKTSYTEKIIIDEEKIELLPDFEAIAYPDSLAVYFTNKSLGAGIKQYIWAFGDGSIARGNSTNHTYNKPGDYNVCLTVTPTVGSSASSCQRITVGTEYSLTPEFTYLFENNQEASFLPYLNVEPDSLIWDFGDGSFSNELQPNHIFTSQQIYLVGLKVYYKGKNAEKLQIINLTDNPSKLIGMFKTEEDFGGYKADSKKRRNKGSLSGDVSRIKFEWEFGDGSADSLNLEPVHTYSTDGTYTVCFNVYNDLSGDSSQYCKEVVVGVPTKIVSQDYLSDIDFYVNNSGGYINIYVSTNKALRSNLCLYDISGRVMDEIYAGTMPIGTNEFKIKTPKEKGIYIVRYQSTIGYGAKKLVVN